MEGLFFTTGEAAEELGVSSARVRQMILAGAISAQKRGRDLLIPSAEVERAKQRPTSPGRPPKLAADVVSTCTPDGGASSAATLQQTKKKATTKASKR